MADSIHCNICGSGTLEPGCIQSTGKIYFRPANARFAKLMTSYVNISAYVCMDCGNLVLKANAEKVRSLVKKKTKVQAPG